MTGSKRCAVCKIVAVLAGIGALNWGFVAFAGVDLVAEVLGAMTPAAKAVYGLVAIAGALAVLSIFNLCPCQKQGCETKK